MEKIWTHSMRKDFFEINKHLKKTDKSWTHIDYETLSMKRIVWHLNYWSASMKKSNDAFLHRWINTWEKDKPKPKILLTLLATIQKQILKIISNRRQCNRLLLCKPVQCL